VIINEILYHPLPSKRGREFVELFNPSTASVDLSSWSLADEITFRIPAGTRIGPGAYLVVAGEPAVVGAIYGISGVLGPFKGKLSNKGGTVSLLDARGDLVEAVAYDKKPPFPAEAAEGGASLERVNPDYKEGWHWRAGAVRPEWFQVKKTGVLTGERLVIYLDGEGSCLIDDVHVTPRDAPSPEAVSNPGFEGGTTGWEASGNHSLSRAEGAGKEGKAALRITARGPGFGRIHSVSTVLSGIPVSKFVTISFWARAEKGAPKIVARIEGEGLLCEESVHLIGGSPGAPNRVRSTDLEPWVRSIWHEPERPLSGQPVTVLARVEDDEAVGAVTLEYSPEAAEGEKPQVYSVPMADHGVAARGGRAFAAMIPPLGEGTVVRYRVSAVDVAGQGARAEAQKAFYVGKPAARGKAVPSFELLVSPAAMESLERAKGAWVPGMLIFDGVVYDRIRVRHRGHSSMGFPKLHFKLHFDGEKLEGKKTVNLSTSWADKSYLREPLAHAIFAEAGVAACEVKRYARLYLNGKYWGLYYQIEQPGAEYLKRNGRDPDGDLFKCYARGMPTPGGNYSPSDYQNKTSKEPHFDQLHQFLLNMHLLDGAELKEYIKKHVDAEEFAGYLAATALVMNSDHVGKNYLLYRDPRTEKWSMFPWDLDLTFGRNYECGEAEHLLNDRIRWDNPILFGTEEHPKCDIPGNRIITKFLSLPENRVLLYKKLAKMLKEFTVPRITRLLRPNYLAIKDEVKLDRTRWGSYGDRATWDFEQRVQEVLNFVDKRGKFLADALRQAMANP
jgi:CotH protein/lamin tail-like protein